MDRLSFRVSAKLRRRIAREARRRRVSQSKVIRECLEAALLDRPGARAGSTCADLAGGLIGSMRGPGDASTNKAYLDEAIVADYAKQGFAGTARYTSARRNRNAKRLSKREAGARAALLIGVNRELFGRLARKDVSTTVKRTIKDYRKTLRKLS